MIQYVILMLEGLLTFISPCLLPMLPIYISYFSASEDNNNNNTNTVKNAFGFVLGFTVVFILLGVFAGFIGGFLIRYQTLLNVLTGGIVIFFGCHYIGLLKIPFLNRVYQNQANVKILGFRSAILFGIVFSIGWTPCVGTFLGSALMLASHQGSMVQGLLLLLCYSIGLGIPFILSAMLLDKFKKSFDTIRKHYKIINKLSGILLIIMGILMITGLLNQWLIALSS